MKIASIDFECSTTHDVINCYIKFPSKDDLDQFGKMPPLLELPIVQQAIKQDDLVLWFCQNQQFCDEIYYLLMQIKKIPAIDLPILDHAIEQYKIAKQQLTAPRIESLNQICKDWSITNNRNVSTAINSNPDAELISINLENRIIHIPDMSWSERCDLEAAEYGTFCKMKFANAELAAAHCKKFAAHSDVKLSKGDSTTVIHGPRSSLHNFRQELLGSGQTFFAPSAELAQKKSVAVAKPKP